jgi:hypothetical protein
LFEALSIFEKLFESKSYNNVQPQFRETAKLSQFQSKYIQNQSFLI